ncbi:1-aminocyclopropane-1-carboxylate deaminase/D-cysteine desulfhydrase [Flavihumibacter sp. ZG627]|uniref:1-aminocyclopropane-1-carboxylate deaminase/D-cysteine desulfhydrase n=1 Tax=Flavihumibacter sp. ZG627 TaxID=1463156 RepID=UPI00057F4CCB|nr:pyridoxal-phosphate dependent enzyme [Flavihumibacter sp. ZG627]KIC91565.1 hypothetical protein HY58_04815 [Flavihumibacter sp. ZG627]
MNIPLPLHSIPIQSFRYTALQSVETDILRLDQRHPVVSGNKWFKLQIYLQNAVGERKKGILSFGGVWSNHLVALAYAAREAGLPSRGIVRGEEGKKLSEALSEARSYGMELVFVSREAYRNPQILQNDPSLLPPEWLVVPEGGRGPEGIAGAETILNLVPDLSVYTHICCAVGTGTMLTGICNAALPSQQIIGISSLKGNDLLSASVRRGLRDANRNFRILFDFHFGGYAKHPPELILFMNEFYAATSIPSDIVYTAKMLYGVDKLLREDYFKKGSRLLLIHSGGLQGNRSLMPGELIF